MNGPRPEESVATATEKGAGAPASDAVRTSDSAGQLGPDPVTPVVPLADDLAARAIAAGAIGPERRRVVERIVRSPDDVIATSARDLAAELGVSLPTLTRAAQDLGFHGLADLRAFLRIRARDLVRRRIHRLAEGTVSDADLIEAALAVMRRDAAAVLATADALAPDTLNAAATALLEARRVYVFGSRGSSGLATILGIRLTYVLEDARILHQTHGDLAEQLSGLDHRDALVAISFPLVDRVVVQTARHAAAVGAAVVTLTADPDDALARLGRIRLVARSERLPLLPSYTAGSAVVNALTTLIALRADRVRPTPIGRTTELLAAFGAFVGDNSTELDPLPLDLGALDGPTTEEDDQP